MTRKRRSSNPGLARYLAQIAARPVLTAEEEALAVERARESDDAGAPNALVESSLAFVVQTAKEFRDYGVPSRTSSTREISASSRPRTASSWDVARAS